MCHPDKPGAHRPKAQTLAFVSDISYCHLSYAFPSAAPFGSLSCLSSLFLVRSAFERFRGGTAACPVVGAARKVARAGNASFCLCAPIRRPSTRIVAHPPGFLVA